MNLKHSISVVSQLCNPRDERGGDSGVVEVEFFPLAKLVGVVGKEFSPCVA